MDHLFNSSTMVANREKVWNPWPKRTRLDTKEDQIDADKEDSETGAPMSKSRLIRRPPLDRGKEEHVGDETVARRRPLALTVDESSDEPSEQTDADCDNDNDNDSTLTPATPPTPETPPRPKRLAYPTVKGADGDNFTSPISEPLLARMPAYSVRLDASRK